MPPTLGMVDSAVTTVQNLITTNRDEAQRIAALVSQNLTNQGLTERSLFDLPESEWKLIQSRTQDQKEFAFIVATAINGGGGLERVKQVLTATGSSSTTAKPAEPQPSTKTPTSSAPTATTGDTSQLVQKLEAEKKRADGLAAQVVSLQNSLAQTQTQRQSEVRLASYIERFLWGNPDNNRDMMGDSGEALARLVNPLKSPAGVLNFVGLTARVVYMLGAAGIDGVKNAFNSEHKAPFRDAFRDRMTADYYPSDALKQIGRVSLAAFLAAVIASTPNQQSTVPVVGKPIEAVADVTVSVPLHVLGNSLPAISRYYGGALAVLSETLIAASDPRREGFGTTVSTTARTLAESLGDFVGSDIGGSIERVTDFEVSNVSVPVISPTQNEGENPGE